jgi:hypothetical protein
MKRFFKILLWVVGALLALIVIVSLLAGPIAKGYVNRHGEDLTGRKVDVAHVGVNLFTGKVNVRDLNVYEEDGETVFAGFDTLDVSVRLLKLPFETLHFGHITLAGLHAKVEQRGQRFNLSSLLEHFASDDTVETKDTTGSDWTLKFYNIRISHARLSYEDLLGGKSASLPDVNLKVPGFVMGGDESTKGGLNIGFDRGGRLNVDADYDSKGGEFAVTVDIDDFSIDNVDTYLADMLDYDRLGGTLDASLVARGNMNRIMGTAISGAVALRNLDLVSSGSPVASFDSLTVAVGNVNLEDNVFDISSIRLGGLNLTYEQWKDYSNIDRLLRADASSAAAADSVADSATASRPADTAAKPMCLTVGSLLVDGGAVTYVDHTLPDPFRFSVKDIRVEAEDVSTTGENNATVGASLQGGGRLNVIWKGDIGEWKRHQDLFLTLKGLDMRQLSPWTVAYTAQPIEEGILSITSHNIIANSRLVGKNTVDIYKLRVGDRRPDVDAELKLPLKTALYVLRDKDGKILIDLPVNGDVDNPEFNYMKIVWKTLGNLLVKVATSPARALAGAMGLSGDDLEFIAVSPDQHSLTSQQYHTLAALATVAQSDSLLSITLIQRMPADGDSTLYRRLNQQVHSYLIEQGLPESRFSIAPADTVVTPGAKTGYAVSSQLTIEE